MSKGKTKSTNRGRPGWGLHLNKILSIWKEKGESLPFNTIHREFVRLGIASNEKYKASRHRILQKLIGEEYLEKEVL